MDRGRVFKIIRNGLAIFVIMFAMVWVRTYYQGRAQYLEGEKNYKEGNLKEAITNYETAIHMYTPFGPYVPASARRLWEIGQAFEADSEYDWALISYRALRSSFYAVRSFYTPYPEWIARTEAEIDRIVAAQKARQQAGSRPIPSPAPSQ